MIRKKKKDSPRPVVLGTPPPSVLLCTRPPPMVRCKGQAREKRRRGLDVGAFLVHKAEPLLGLLFVALFWHSSPLWMAGKTVRRSGTGAEPFYLLTLPSCPDSRLEGALPSMTPAKKTTPPSRLLQAVGGDICKTLNFFADECMYNCHNNKGRHMALMS